MDDGAGVDLLLCPDHGGAKPCQRRRARSQWQQLPRTTTSSPRTSLCAAAATVRTTRHDCATCPPRSGVGALGSWGLGTPASGPWVCYNYTQSPANERSSIQPYKRYSRDRNPIHHPPAQKPETRETERERRGRRRRAGAAARGTAALTLYTGALLSLRGGGGAPLQGPGSPGSRSSFSARLRLACFCSLRNWSAAAASHSGSSAASAASAAFAAAAGSGGGRCAINSLPHSGHRTTVRFFCKLTPSVALHRGHEKLEGWGGGLGFLGFGGASTSSGLACRRSMDVSTKWSISASGVRQLRATGCAARAKPMHASYLQFDEFDARGLRVGNALDHVCGHTNASAAMGPPHAGGLFSPALVKRALTLEAVLRRAGAAWWPSR